MNTEIDLLRGLSESEAETLLGLGSRAEALGYDGLWINEEPIGRFVVVDESGAAARRVALPAAERLTAGYRQDRE